MTLFSDNPSPSLLMAEHVDPSNPSAGYQRLFVDTDHLFKMVDSSGTVTTFGTGLADPMTTRGDIIVRNAANATARLGIGSSGKVLSSDGTDISWQTPAGGSSWPPLDQYSVDGTYGDTFAAGSLNGRWTRRNYGSGAETYQFTKAGTGIRIACAGRANGDGYYQTAPAGDWTFAMKYSMEQYGSNVSNWGIAVITTAGTGLCTQIYTAPIALLMGQVTTYTTYGGSYVQPGSSSAAPNLSFMNPAGLFQSRPIWVYMRKSGTSYYVNLSLDGEAWWVEGGPITFSGTVDRIGMAHSALGTATGSTGATNDVYWFNKIA